MHGGYENEQDRKSSIRGLKNILTNKFCRWQDSGL